MNVNNIIFACLPCLADKAESVTVRVQAIAIGRSALIARDMPYKFAGHLSINQSSGMFWNEVHGISCLSHHWAYVVFDFFDMGLKGD